MSLFVIVGIVYAILLGFVLALLKVAARADARMAQMWEDDRADPLAREDRA